MNHDIILVTPRLLLRKKVVEDAPFFFEMNSDPIVNKYTGDGPFKDMKAAEDIVKYVIDQYEKNGYGRWLVADKITGEPLGWCGLKYHDDTKDTDIGYRFPQRHWGKGYATESAKACIDYGFNVFKLKRIIGNAMQENTASINVFKKLGMTFVENNLLHDLPSVTYDIKRD